MMEDWLQNLSHLFIRFPVLLVAIIFHEVAHGWAALYWGDRTALREGRLTLNPLPHVDVLGTLILPCLSLLFPGSPVLLGWAKPVPIHPSSFRHYRYGMITVALAGPLMNFFLGFLSAGLCVLIRVTIPEQTFFFEPLFQMTFTSVFMNFFLGFFNLFPLPPLDGSRLMSVLLPPRLLEAYETLSAYSFYVFLGLLFLGFFRLLFYPTQFLAMASFQLFEAIVRSLF